MTDWKSKHNPINKQPQTPHPTRSGFTSIGTILVDDAKTAAWQTRWRTYFEKRWEVRDGRYYPRASESKP